MQPRSAGRPHPWTSLWAVCCLAIVLLAALGLNIACQQQERERSPALPPGFAESQVPKVPLNAYVYVDQGRPILLSPVALGLTDMQDGDLGAERLAAWAGPEIGAFGLRAVLGSEEEARRLQEKSTESGGDLWLHREGATLSLVHGKGDWSASLQNALQSGTMVPFREAHPEGWKSVLLLPESPPRRPVAAGVLLVDEKLLGALAQAETRELRDLATALRMASAIGASFAVYTDRPLELPGAVDVAYAQAAQMRAVVVVRTRLVGPILGAALGGLAGALQLERVEQDGRSLYRYQQAGVTAILTAQGGTLYIVVAPGGPTEGEDLLAYLD